MNMPLIFRTKQEVIERLTTWFPSMALHLNIDRIQNSGKISISNVQFMFWEQILQNGNLRKILMEAVKCDVPHRRFTPRPTVDLILWDLVFLSHVDNPVLPFSTGLTQLHGPNFKMFGHSFEVEPNAVSFADAVKTCSDMANKCIEGKNLHALWHGTNGPAGGLIIHNFSFTPSAEKHDFGPGIYTFSEALWAASFGLDRSFYSVQNVDRGCCNVMLVCILLPDEFYTERLVDVEKTQLSTREKENLQNIITSKYNKEEGYLESLNSWQKFVKYCRVMNSAPSTTTNTPIFYGTLHDCDKTVETDNCSPPKKDTDDWTQYCIQIANGFNIPDVEFLFFELQAKDGNGFYSCGEDRIDYEKALLDKWSEMRRV